MGDKLAGIGNVIISLKERLCEMFSFENFEAVSFTSLE
jgi:hypothetical protein